jgi:16S rRNA (guanine966-N2)-methyltransferase
MLLKPMTKPKTRRSPPAQPERPGAVRIIAGKWRRRRLEVADAAGLRPTPDRVRETLFAWLSDRLADSRCLDLFAGSGALGFEAASRGAGEVVMIERDSTLVAALLEQRARFDAKEVRVIQADAVKWLESGRDQFDIIFVDPPFQSLDLGDLCARIDRCGRLQRSGTVYLETGVKGPELDLPDGWILSRSNRAGQVRYYLAMLNASAD